jgi:hypothetical protein
VHALDDRIGGEQQSAVSGRQDRGIVSDPRVREGLPDALYDLAFFNNTLASL